MEQNLLSSGKLLNENGNLAEAGYALSLMKEYSRSEIKAPKLRIKEWDYYYVGDDRRGVALTVADNSYMGMLSASVLNFETRTYKTSSVIRLFTRGKTDLPATSVRGDILAKTKNAHIDFQNNGARRKLLCDYKKFDRAADLHCAIDLITPTGDTMVIATPFSKPKHFYYNQKINLMAASGGYSLGDETYTFGDSAFGLLDWGRGVWTYKNTWYWGSLSTRLPDGRLFGFNIGYGFGDASKATENMLFLDGVAHKLEHVTFQIPKNSKGKEEYLQPWVFTSSDKRFEMEFQPILDRRDCTSLIVLKSDQHQVFGRFYGNAVLDSGETIRLNGQIGFAEKVFNKW